MGLRNVRVFTVFLTLLVIASQVSAAVSVPCTMMTGAGSGSAHPAVAMDHGAHAAAGEHAQAEPSCCDALQCSPLHLSLIHI